MKQPIIPAARTHSIYCFSCPVCYRELQSESELCTCYGCQSVLRLQWPSPDEMPDWTDDRHMTRADHIAALEAQESLRTKEAA